MRHVFTLGVAAIVGLLMIPMGSAQAATPLTVCVGAGGTLRLLDKNSACKAGEQKRLFAEWEPETPEPPDTDDEKELRAQVDTLSKRLAALERKKAFEEDERTPSRVTAPFEVVAPDGTVILRVAQNLGGKTSGGPRITIGPDNRGNEHYAVRVYNGGQQLVAGIGQGSVGAGIVYTMEKPGGNVGGMMVGRLVQVLKDDVVKAVMGADNGGYVGVVEGSQIVASLSKSSAGDGGNVTTRLNNGFGVFSAGAAQDGGGEACVNRVTGGGQQRRACLGIELPSMGLGK